MTVSKSNQMSLLAPAEQSKPQPDFAKRDTGLPRLAVTMDHREWLAFLADEWWPVCDQVKETHLGVDASCGDPLQEGRIAISAWILPERLPAVDVLAYRTGRWAKVSMREISTTHEEVVWPGPIPLFAVEAFSVATQSEQARVIAMAKGFSNIEVPTQPVKVGPVVTRPPVGGAPEPSTRLQPPPQWNAIRGAAAMAVWAVPAVDPWLDLLCDSFSVDASARGAVAMKAPWWHAPPWRSVMPQTTVPPLWTAMLEVLGQVHMREQWHPAEVLESIRERACQLGADAELLADLAIHTRAIIDDREAIDVHRAAHDPLGLTLQLVLLRPSPDRFASWKDDLPAMPPAVWWTGATLAGFLGGYRDLELRFRGLPAARRLLALRTWQLARHTLTTMPTWPDDPGAPLQWKLEGEKIQLRTTEGVWAERAGSSRGRWYRANFADAQIQTAAIDVAQRLYRACLQRCLRVHDTRLPIFGDGKVLVAPSGEELIVQGKLSIALHAGAELVDQLNVHDFRDWIARGSIAQRLPEPPAPPLRATPTDSSAQPLLRRSAISTDGPPGLLVVPDFITADEEGRLLETVESARWQNDLSRRVQHYGWRYDYKARRVAPEAYLGPLPEWASELGRRLVDNELIGELPDQVIVNEYVGNQGIGRHIDCPTCFRGAIVTISLNESWQMIFRNVTGEKHEITLDRRSAVVMDGPARNAWTHEIPKRIKEPSGPRGRRVSLTFRKVQVEQTPNSIAKRSSRRK